MKEKTNVGRIALAVCGTMVGCMSNAIFLEYLVKADPGSGTLATFGQYLLIALEGFIFSMKFGTKKRVIPFKSYLSVVCLFLVANVVNNYVFKFNISMPLHMIFRSASLITNMLMCIWILKRKYSFMKFLSVGLISAGVLICTLITGSEIKNEASSGTDGDFFWWLLGISILVFALFVSSLLGIYQENLFAKYGKHPSEALYYTHVIPLPVYALFWQNIVEHFNIALVSPPLDIPLVNIKVPSTIIFLIANAATQFLCIKSVYLLTTEASSLSVTLVLTLRKFLSLILSIIYFNNVFTIYHWIGTILVFIGTIIFTEIPQKLISIEKSVKEKTAKKSKAKKSPKKQKQS